MVWLNELTGIDTALTSLLMRGHRRARSVRRPVLVSLTEPAPALDPLDVFARGAALAPDRVLWQQPSEGFALAGLGAAYVIAPDGAGRFTAASAAWRAMIDDALVERDVGLPEAGPVLIGGFAFDPERPSTALWDGFPDARLVLPRLLFTAVRGQHWLTLNAVVWPDTDPEAMTATLARERALLLSGAAVAASTALPGSGARPEVRATARAVRPPAAWKSDVAAAAEAVRQGALEKVVLAREVRVTAAEPFDVAGVLEHLRESYPTCYVFAVARGERVFLGATPERLVRLSGGEVRVTCLAGSTPRGATPEEDERLGAALLASEKDRVEHAVVVRALREALDGACIDVAVPDEPVLLSVRNVHHLYTPITGRVRNGASVLDLVQRLHPTPAVGGTPRREAMRYIRDHEGMDRGWYAAPVGWIDADGGGEYAVALRSALVDGREAALFAGCGIVAGSDPEQEYAESWVKLRPMLSALGVRDR